jgi:8-oxo-dGTP diphosphatase
MIGQRISAGGIVIRNGKVLLVHHYEKDRFDFWVMPGGGIEGDEGIFRAAEREVWEETSLIVTAEKIAYVEDFIDEGKYVCKFWVCCSFENGELSTEHKDANEGYLRDAKFFSTEELRRVNAFPLILKDIFWRDLEAGFPTIKYLGYERHEN